MGRETPQVYRRLKARYQAERIWIEERVQAINEEMAQLNREAEAIGSLQQVKDRFCCGDLLRPRLPIDLDIFSFKLVILILGKQFEAN